VRYLIIVLSAFTLSGCVKPFYHLQAPFSVEDPTVNGGLFVDSGPMIRSARDRYWMAYQNALDKDGYDLEDSDAYPYFRPGKLEAATAGDNAANALFWREGKTYARLLCNDFFDRVAFAFAHREHARKQTNIAGGLITGIMGLAGASPELVGGTGLGFASAESAFNAYNESFMVTPDLGLMHALVRTTQDAKDKLVDEATLLHVTDVQKHLADYVAPCTFTGMQALLDESLKRKLSDFPTTVPVEFMTKEEYKEALDAK